MSVTDEKTRDWWYVLTGFNLEGAESVTNHLDVPGKEILPSEAPMNKRKIFS